MTHIVSMDTSGLLGLSLNDFLMLNTYRNECLYPERGKLSILGHSGGIGTNAIECDLRVLDMPRLAPHKWGFRVVTPDKRV